MLWNEQRTVSIAQEAEVMSQRIIIYSPPVSMQESTYEQEQCALRLMEIGDEHIHNLIFIARHNDYLRGEMYRVHIIGIHILEDCQ